MVPKVCASYGRALQPKCEDSHDAFPITVTPAATKATGYPSGLSLRLSLSR